MQNSLAHLPIEKRQELKAIVAAIRTYPEVEMLILFGSYARGSWVEDTYEEEGVRYQYQSDYDLLAIVKTRSIHKQRRLEDDLLKATRPLPGIRTPRSVIVHDIHYINAQLDEGQYFFSDLKKEGILLYSSGNLHLHEATKALDPEQRYRLAQEDFEHWFGHAIEFWIDFENAFQRGSYKNAAFMLHQATEHLYNAILLVYVHYKPKTHDLEALRNLTHALDDRLIKVFPLATPEEISLFKLLRDAYVDARYKKNYVVTEQELLWLSVRVKALQQLTEKICLEKIQAFLMESSRDV
ncbi:MAG: hypothetical protein K0Q74_613 [Gammaproteobacteria bacterium]|jgi:HEPN domain-containing protein/predicted nucleotidyltransferase|nr:hypothetical protein [Gammaproteobacteria bacterium]